MPCKGRYGLHDYEKMFCPNLKNDQNVFELRGIDREHDLLPDPVSQAAGVR